MSSNSSKRTNILRVWAGHIRNILAILALIAWPLVSVFAIGGIIAGSVLYGGTSQLGITPDDSSALFQMVLSVMVYTVGAAILLIEPYTIRRMSVAQIKKLVGLARRPVLRDLGFGLLAWGAYMLLSTIAATAVKAYIPGVNLDQEQEIGFQTLASGLDIFYAFLVIVIAAPVVEEFVFRGYLYGSLRSKMPRWVAAIIVSVLFGAIHGQVNVAIDTFMLSMAACYLREKTGAIWGGVVVHALKNSLAFWLLFLAPEWLRQLLMTL